MDKQQHNALGAYKHRIKGKPWILMTSAATATIAIGLDSADC